VELSAYETKSNRRKLTGAYSDKSPLKGIFLLQQEDTQIALYSSDGRALIFSAAQLTAKTTRSTIGVAVMSLRKNKVVESAALLEQTTIHNTARYRAKSIPSSGANVRGEDAEEKQITFDD